MGSERISARQKPRRPGVARSVMTSRMPTKCLAIVLAAMILPAAAQQNPLARPTPNDPGGLAGRWNGADLESRSNCAHPENNGNHGTYAQYDFNVDAPNHFMSMAQTGVTGLNCSWGGNLQFDDFHVEWSGEYNCTDGKSGTFHSKSILITPSEMSMRLSIKLAGSEACDVSSVLGGSRY